MCFHRDSMKYTHLTLHKLTCWCENFVESRSFRRVLGDSPRKPTKNVHFLTISTPRNQVEFWYFTQCKATFFYFLVYGLFYLNLMSEDKNKTKQNKTKTKTKKILFQQFFFLDSRFLMLEDKKKKFFSSTFIFLYLSP